MELAKKETVIVHFTGTKKPWHLGCKHPERGLYWKYLKKTPYKRCFSDNPTPINILRSIAPKRVLEFFFNSKNKLKSLFSDLVL